LREDGLLIVDAELRLTRPLVQLSHGKHVCVSEERLYVSRYGRAGITSLDASSFTRVAEHEVSDGRFVTYLGTALAGDTLYAIGCGNDDDELVSLDAQTLVVRSRFHGGLWRKGGANGIAVVGETLFVGDILQRAVHLFSLGGEQHVGSIRGTWREPEHVLAHGGNNNSKAYVVRGESPSTC
jgi:hypothetical protein